MLIALDTSVLVAIAKAEPEKNSFNAILSQTRAVIGTPTLLEVAMVLPSLVSRNAASAFVEDILADPEIEVVPFSLPMFRAANSAFQIYGKGRGHPAQLNFGDCVSYAVAKVHDVPLLYKGNDFARTDIRPAILP